MSERMATAPTSPDSPGRELDFALLALLKRQTELFTGRDSSSIRVDTARRLLDSIRFTLSQAMGGAPLTAGAIEGQRGLDALAAGRREIEKKSRRCRELWERA